VPVRVVWVPVSVVLLVAKLMGAIEVGLKVAVTLCPVMMLRLVEQVTTRPPVEVDDPVEVHGLLPATENATAPSPVPGLGPGPPKIVVWSMLTVACRVTVSSDAAVVPGVGVLTRTVLVGAGFTTRGLKEPNAGVY
jgi:hypothetical protein